MNSSHKEIPMRNINMGRVILGGLLAGVVMNIAEYVLNMVVLKDLWNEAMLSLNRPSMDSTSPVMFIILSFFLGIMAVWVYAAIRSRFFSPAPMRPRSSGR